jgi:RNA polymerase sigma-70 factor (ECF subfamily)
MSLLAARLVPPADRDPLVQEAIALAWRRRSSYEASGRPLHACLLALVAERARRRHRRHRPTLELVDKASGESPRDRDQELELAMEELSARQRLAINLHYFVGLDLTGCAAVLGCSEAAVESLLQRARSQLRGHLRDDLFGGAR